MTTRDRFAAAMRARRRRLLRHPSLLHPLSRNWGFERGTPIDRYYIERFLRRHAGDIRGRVAEVKDDEYVQRFAADGAITRSDVIDVDVSNARATIVGDVADPATLPTDAFDCVVFTQTLQFVWDAQRAVQELHRSLRPGGALLLSGPGISRAVPDLPGRDYWRFTTDSVRRLLCARFPAGEVFVESYGNVRSASAFLYGMAVEELARDELDLADPDYPVVVVARAVKASRPDDG